MVVLPVVLVGDSADHIQNGLHQVVDIARDFLAVVVHPQSYPFGEHWLVSWPSSLAWQSNCLLRSVERPEPGCSAQYWLFVSIKPYQPFKLRWEPQSAHGIDKRFINFISGSCTILNS